MVSEEIQELDLLRMDDSLNPCFGGRWSRSMDDKVRTEQGVGRLNPCFGGRWSRSQELDLLRMDDQVS